MSLPPALAMLSRGLARAPSLGWPAVLETAAHGTVRALVSYGRREIVQDRGGGKVGMLDAAPTLIVEEAAAPGLASGDLVLVGGRLFHVRSPMPNGRGRTTADLEAAQASRATWTDGDGKPASATVYLTEGGPDGRLALRVGGEAAGLTRDPALSRFPAGATFETDDDGAQFEILASAPWAEGLTRLALRRVA